MFYNVKQLRHSELTLLRNECELERTQTLTILMLALQNTRLAGYMLTGNRSMFLDTDGSSGDLSPSPIAEAFRLSNEILCLFLGFFSTTCSGVKSSFPSWAVTVSGMGQLTVTENVFWDDSCRRWDSLGK